MCPLDSATEILLPEIALFSPRTRNVSSTFLLMLGLTRTVNNRKCTKVANSIQYTFFSNNTSIFYLKICPCCFYTNSYYSFG